MKNSSIWPIERTLSGATIPGPSGAGSDGKEGVFRLTKSSSINEAIISVCFVSYPGISLRESYPSVETQLVYNATPADWAI